MKKILLFVYCILPLISHSQYNGTASVSQGLGVLTQGNLYPCANGRITDMGTITALDSTVWTVPADVNFNNPAIPFASDLYNSCNGATYPNESAALSALSGTDIIGIDPNGELITAYLFADNYFELYINGIPVGKDDVPYTQFNSSIVRFRVSRPFTIAAMLVDWEEKLGVGCEVSNGFQYHAGDGGLVAVFKDTTNQIIAITGSDWKAQTFYTAPVMDLSCPMEINNLRLTDSCSTQDSNNGIAYYGLHWPLPPNWMDPNFNDSLFPQASIYTNAAVGVNNKPAYTNFTNLFDDPAQDAEFIWSTNLVLDNLVLVRYTVPVITGEIEPEDSEEGLHVFPNPASKELKIDYNKVIKADNIHNITLYDMTGRKIFETFGSTERIPLEGISPGTYEIIITSGKNRYSRTIIIQ